MTVIIYDFYTVLWYDRPSFVIIYVINNKDGRILKTRFPLISVMCLIYLFNLLNIIGYNSSKFFTVSFVTLKTNKHKT